MSFPIDPALFKETVLKAFVSEEERAGISPVHGCRFAVHDSSLAKYRDVFNCFFRSTDDFVFSDFCFDADFFCERGPSSKSQSSYVYWKRNTSPFFHRLKGDHSPAIRLNLHYDHGVIKPIHGDEVHGFIAASDMPTLKSWESSTTDQQSFSMCNFLFNLPVGRHQNCDPEKLEQQKRDFVCGFVLDDNSEEGIRNLNWLDYRSVVGIHEL